MTAQTDASGTSTDQVRIQDVALRRAVESVASRQQKELIVSAAELNRAADIYIPVVRLAEALELAGETVLVVETGRASYRIPLATLPLDSQSGGSEGLYLKVSVGSAGYVTAAAVADKAAFIGASVLTDGVFQFSVWYPKI